MDGGLFPTHRFFQGVFVVVVAVAAIVLVLTVEGGKGPYNGNIAHHVVRSLPRIRFYVMWIVLAASLSVRRVREDVSAEQSRSNVK